MFGVEFADQSLRDVEDAAAFLNIPVLGSILTIVTPEDRARRRRKTFIITGVILMLIAAFVVFCVVWNYLHPGSLANLMTTVKSYIF